MTWEQLIGKIREGLAESGGRLRLLGDSLPDLPENGGALDATEVFTLLIMLILAVSDLHSVVEHMTIGLDAVIATLREATESQEVESE